MPARLLLLVLTVAAVSACSNRTPDDVALAPGAVVVATFPVNKSPTVLSSSHESMRVTSVARDGDRVVVLLTATFSSIAVWSSNPDGTYDPSSAGGGSDAHLFVSEDLGATWSERPIPPPNNSPTSIWRATRSSANSPIAFR